MTQPTQIVDALSAYVTVLLEADQHDAFAVPVAPLTAGKILLGREHLNEHDSPSQIVCIPTGFTFGPPNTLSNQVRASDGSVPGQIARKLQRPLASLGTIYEFHVWGQANPAELDRGDFDATMRLIEIIVQAAQELAMTSVTLVNAQGVWEDQQEGAPMRSKAGHRVRFNLPIWSPIRASSVQFPPRPLTIVPAVPTFATGGD